MILKVFIHRKKRQSMWANRSLGTWKPENERIHPEREQEKKDQNKDEKKEEKKEDNKT